MKEEGLKPGTTVTFWPSKKVREHYKAGKPYVDLLPDPGDMFKDFMGMIPMQALYNKWDKEGKVSSEPVILDSDIFLLIGQILELKNLARYYKRVEENIKNTKGEK